MMKRCINCTDLPWLKFKADERGATAIEYAMIASLVSIALLTALVALGSGTDNLFDYIMSNVSPALAGSAGK